MKGTFKQAIVQCMGNGELSTALGAVDSRNRKSLRCRRLFRGGGCSDAVRSEDELFEFQFAQFVEPRNEGREMRGRLMGGERLGVAPCLADHQYVGARGALEQSVGDAAATSSLAVATVSSRLVAVVRINTLSRIIVVMFLSSALIVCD